MRREKKKLTTVSSFIVEGGFFLLLVATPIAFGSVEPWAYTGMEIISAIMLIAFIVFRSSLKKTSLSVRRAIVPLRLLLLYLSLGVFIMGGIVQVIPLPLSFIKGISPATYKFWLLTGRRALSSWSSFSLYPGLTGMELLKIFSYMIIFVILIGYRPHNKPRSVFISRLIMAIIITGFVISVAGIMQKYTSPKIIFGLRSIKYGNPFGPFVNRNHFAGYIIMVIPLVLGMLLSGQNSPGRRTFRSRIIESDPRRILLVFISVVMVAALLLSLSRGGIVSLILSSIYFLFFASRYRLVTKKQILYSLVILLITLVIIFICFDIGPLVRRFHTMNPDLEGRQVRLVLWQDTSRIFMDFPVLGTGLGTFKKVYPWYKTIHLPWIYTHAENDYLQLIAEMGLWGGVSATLVIILYFRALLTRISLVEKKDNPPRRRRESSLQFSGRSIIVSGSTAVLAALLNSIVNFNLHIPAIALLTSVVAAFSISQMASHGRSVASVET